MEAVLVASRPNLAMETWERVVSVLGVSGPVVSGLVAMEEPVSGQVD